MCIHTTAKSYDEFTKRMKCVQEDTEAALKGVADDMKCFYDWKHKPEEYVKGKRVWLDAEHIITGHSKMKLDWKHLGPFTIVKKLSPTAFRLKLLNGW